MNRHWPLWLGLFAGLAALGSGMIAGTDLQERWQLATRYTAQIAYPLFLVTFVASSLVRLFPSRWTLALMRNRRWWGLGFAACFFFHLLALLVYNWLRDQFPPADFLDRGVWAYAVLLAMVMTSTDAARRHLGRWWKALHSVGMWGFCFIFVLAFYVDALMSLKMPEFTPLAEPCTLPGLAALALKLAAWMKTRRQRRQPTG